MKRPLRMTRFTLALLMAFALTVSTAWALDPVYTDFWGNAVRGYDPVAYFTEGKPVKGQKDFRYTWQEATWSFASGENRDAFIRSPESFAPQYGGYCAWAVSQGYTASTVPEAWHIHEDKLYLNYSLAVKKTWSQDIPGNIVKADRNWPGLLAGNK